MNINNKSKAIVALLLNSSIIGFSYLIVKNALFYSTPILILTDRLVLAFVFLQILKFVGLLKIEKIEKHSKRKIFIISLFYPICFFLFQNFGIKRISTSETAIIYGLIPVITLFFSALFLKQKATTFQNLGVLFSVCGISYISFASFQSVSGDFLGYVFVTLSVISSGIYYVFIKKYLSDIPTVTITYYLISFAMPIMILFGLINDKDFWKIERFSDYNYLLLLSYLGVLSTFVTSSLTNFGIKKLSPTHVSIFTNLSPVFGVLAGVIFLKEKLTQDIIVGGVLIFSGVIVSLIKNEKQ